MRALSRGDMHEFTATKASQIGTLGYEAASRNHLKLRFDSVADDTVAEAWLGLRPLPFTSIEATETRFGIELPLTAPMTPEALTAVVTPRSWAVTATFEDNLGGSKSVPAVLHAMPGATERVLVRTLLLELHLERGRSLPIKLMPAYSGDVPSLLEEWIAQTPRCPECWPAAPSPSQLVQRRECQFHFTPPAPTEILVAAPQWCIALIERVLRIMRTAGIADIPIAPHFILDNREDMEFLHACLEGQGKIRFPGPAALPENQPSIVVHFVQIGTVGIGISVPVSIEAVISDAMHRAVQIRPAVLRRLDTADDAFEKFKAEARALSGASIIFVKGPDGQMLVEF